MDDYMRLLLLQPKRHWQLISNERKEVKEKNTKATGKYCINSQLRDAPELTLYATLAPVWSSVLLSFLFFLPMRGASQTKIPLKCPSPSPLSAFPQAPLCLSPSPSFIHNPIPKQNQRMWCVFFSLVTGDTSCREIHYGEVYSTWIWTKNVSKQLYLFLKLGKKGLFHQRLIIWS